MYTPGLTVKEGIVVEKVRRLPLEGEVVVDEGVRVAADTVVARTHLPGNVYPVNAASILNIEPGELKACMKKGQGDEVEQGEELALSRGLFGLFRTPMNAPVSGTIEILSEVTGQLIIREPPIPVEMKAYIDGVVSEVLPGEGVKVKTPAVLVQGIFGIGGERQGPIAMKVSRPDEALDAERITEEDWGRIVVAGAFVDAAAFGKAVQVGAAGLVTGGIRYGDLKAIMGEEIGVAVTGAEAVGTTLVVTEGFGRIAMSRHTFDLLGRHDGESASMNGATQIRAGVIRPELIIPLPDVGEETVEELVSLDIGTWVRIIRAPQFGTLGKVVELPRELKRMESETLTRSVVIETEAGIVELPRANVEIFKR